MILFNHNDDMIRRRNRRVHHPAYKRRANKYDTPHSSTSLHILLCKTVWQRRLDMKAKNVNLEK